MSNEFMTAVEALRHAGDAMKSAGEALEKIADLFEQRLDTEKPESAPAETTPEPESKVTKADVKALCVGKSRTGHTDEVKALLTKYGAKNITGLKDDQLESFYHEAEVIGNA